MLREGRESSRYHSASWGSSRYVMIDDDAMDGGDCSYLWQLTGSSPIVQYVVRWYRRRNDARRQTDDITSSPKRHTNESTVACSIPAGLTFRTPPQSPRKSKRPHTIHHLGPNGPQYTATRNKYQSTDTHQKTSNQISQSFPPLLFLNHSHFCGVTGYRWYYWWCLAKCHSRWCDALVSHQNHSFSDTKAVGFYSLTTC